MRKRKKTSKAPTSGGKARRSAPRPSAAPDIAGVQGEVSEDALAPPPREATILRSDLERQEEERLQEHTGAGPRLTGGDVDADWERGATVGEEAVGGTVATPDQDVADELGEAWGVPRAPEAEVRTSDEILKQRDRKRWTHDE